MSYYLLLIKLFFAVTALFLLWKTVRYLKNMWHYKKVKATPFPKPYKAIIKEIHQYNSLSKKSKSKLHLLILLFIENKEFIGSKMAITDEVKVIIAFYSSLIRLGFKPFEKDDTKTIIVYPKHFIVENQNREMILEGQSSNGTVILSWQDIRQNISTPCKDNVIIHEFAHELDFEDGYADGTPVLTGYNYRRWSKVFSQAFESLQEIYQNNKIEEGFELLGSYALKNEAEFFAVKGILKFL